MRSFYIIFSIIIHIPRVVTILYFFVVFEISIKNPISIGTVDNVRKSLRVRYTINDLIIYIMRLIWPLKIWEYIEIILCPLHRFLNRSNINMISVMSFNQKRFSND